MRSGIPADEIGVGDGYGFGDYLRALVSEARAPQQRRVAIRLGAITVAGFATFWVIRGPAVAALLGAGIALISMPLSYLRSRRLRRGR